MSSLPHSGLPEMLSPDVRIENIDKRMSGSPPQSPKARRTLLASFDPGEEAEITATGDDDGDGKEKEKEGNEVEEGEVRVNVNLSQLFDSSRVLGRADSNC